jgi:tetratricopeptide (TPR) repeat protein
MGICKKYESQESHRLYVYQSCTNVFHRLFVEAEDELADVNIEAIEDIFLKMETTFETYKSDVIYFHLGIVLSFLRLEYYNHYKLYRKAESYFEDVNDSIGSLLSSYNSYTYPSQFLFTKLERHARLNSLETLYEENQGLFHDFEPDLQNVPQYVTYICYRAICQYYAGKYEEAIRGLNKLLNEISLKRFQYVHLEIKLLLALQYTIIKENELLLQLVNSIQRQIRILSKETCIHAVQIIKILKIAGQANKSDKEAKLRVVIEKLKKTIRPVGFSLIRYIKFDDDFIKRLM